MKPGFLLAGVLLAVSSTLVLAQPKSLLPPGFDNPTPTPTPAPAPRPTAAPAAVPAQGGPAVLQPLPGTSPSQVNAPLPSNLPPVSELEKMDPDQLDELFGLKPKYDIPPGAQRALVKVGVIGFGEGGFPSHALEGQPASLIRAALAGTTGPLVSRWGHILLRRALASRLNAPQGMDPVEFAALRADLLNRMGEGAVARALVQDVDSANYNPQLAAAAFNAYIETGDLVGICPVEQLNSKLLATPHWKLMDAVCAAFNGEGRRAESDLDKALSRGTAPRIDVLLAQRYAGAAGEGQKSVTIEWDDVDQMTPWRLALSRALGIDIPDKLMPKATSTLFRNDVLYPATPLLRRVAAADAAARDGILSSAAMIDLYSQLWSDADTDSGDKRDARQLREAYVASDPKARMSAMQSLWGGTTPEYGRQVPPPMPRRGCRSTRIWPTRRRRSLPRCCRPASTATPCAGPAWWTKAARAGRCLPWRSPIARARCRAARSILSSATTRAAISASRASCSLDSPDSGGWTRERCAAFPAGSGSISIARPGGARPSTWPGSTATRRSWRCSPGLACRAAVGTR